MQRANVFSSQCPSREILVNITSKWGVLAIAALYNADTPLRFKDFRERIEGISDRMLSQTLHRLERDGILTKSETHNVTYQLSELGKELASPLLQLIGTVEANIGDIMQQQAAHDAQR